MNLPKDDTKLLGSILKSRNLLLPGVSFLWFRHHEKVFVSYFAQEDKIVYCIDVQGLTGHFKIQYDPMQWRFFIDSLKRGNSFAAQWMFLRFHPCWSFHAYEGNPIELGIFSL